MTGLVLEGWALDPGRAAEAANAAVGARDCVRTLQPLLQMAISANPAEAQLERKEPDEMTAKSIATILLLFALATAAVASMAVAAPNNATPASPGACDMLHTNDHGLVGMMNDRHVFDVMIPLVEASLAAGCTP